MNKKKKILTKATYKSNFYPSRVMYNYLIFFFNFPFMIKIILFEQKKEGKIILIPMQYKS